MNPLEELEGLFPSSGNLPSWSFLSSNITELDKAMGGGFPFGRITEVFGTPSSFKSALAYHMLGRVQEEGGSAVLLDAETSYVADWVKKFGVDVEKLRLSFPVSLEDAIKRTSQVIDLSSRDPENIYAVAIDPLTSLLTEKELASEVGASDAWAERARAITSGAALWQNQLNQAYSTNRVAPKVLVIVINHAKQQLGMTYTKYYSPGGSAIKFYSAIRVLLTKVKDLKDSKTNEINGVQIKAKIEKNKLAVPFKIAEWNFHFESGVVDIKRQKKKTGDADEEE